MKKFCAKMLLVFAVFHAMMIHKMYLIPEVQIDPLGPRDVPPLPYGGVETGYHLGLLENQQLTAFAFIGAFFLIYIVLISQYGVATDRRNREA